MRFDPKKTQSMANHHHDHPVVALAYFLMSQASGDRYEFDFKQRHIPRWMKPKSSDHMVLGRENVKIN
jgi:hypothetical protein